MSDLNKDSFKNTVRIEIVEPTPFPMAMLKFKYYDGAKAFGFIVFILGTLYFISGLYNLMFWENSWYKPDGILKIISFFYHLIAFTLVYCFTWLIFDKKGIEGYALALFSFILGLIYILSPVDFIPDALPVFGTLDDAIIGIGSIIMGFRGYYNYKGIDRLKKNMVELIKDGKNDDAIKIFLKENGYTLK